MSKEIGKSPEMLEKEASIIALGKQIKKERTTLKRLQTRLKNTKQDITDIHRKVSSSYASNLEKMDTLRREVLEMLKACVKFTEMASGELESLNMLIEDIAEIIDDESLEKPESDRGAEQEQEERAKMRDMFEQFQVKPTEKEQKDIRKVFIKLSTNFHPDKAKNEKEREDFHSLMQEINEAYQSGDIEKLLELESMYLSGETVDYTSKATTVDILTQEISRLERDLDFIKSQVSRTSSEIKSLRSSEMGTMLSEINRAEKEGHSLKDFTDEMNSELDGLVELRDTLLQCVEAKSMEPLNEVSRKRSRSSEAEFMEQLGLDEDGMFDIGSFFDSDMDLESETVPNPKFPKGSSVRIRKNVCHPALRSISLKGMEGRVIKVYKFNGEEYYLVNLDSVSLNGIPNNLIGELVDEGEEEFSSVEINSKDLKSVPPRDTEQEAMASHRIFFHSYRWYDLPPAKRAKMLEILLRFPERSDEKNWMFALSDRLQFPFNATSVGYYNDKGTAAKITGIQVWDESDGLIVTTVIRNKLIVYPLYDFTTNGENKDIMELYDSWIETD